MSMTQTQELAILAIIEGDEKALNILLKAHPNLVKAKIQDGDNMTSILHYVAANGVSDKYQKTPVNAVAIAKILFAAGADPNAVSDYYGGCSALESLVSSVHPYMAGVQEELVSVFIKNGAPVDGLQADGMPLSTALAFWYPGAAARLIAHGSRVDNIVFAAAAGRRDLLEQWSATDKWLAPTSYPEPFDRQLDLPLQLNTAFVKAALCNQLSVIDFFLQQSHDINAKSVQGQCALHEAAYRGEIDTAKYLIDQGADIHLKDSQFEGNALGWAKAGNRPEVVEFFIHRSKK